MAHGKNRIPYWIDRRLTGLAGPEYHAIISFGLPFESEDCQYGKSQVYGLYDQDEYRRQKRNLEEKLRSLVVPDADAAVKAGKLLEDLPRLWKSAEAGERRRILMTMLDAVYVDTVEEKRVVAIRPRPAFSPLFEIATTRDGCGIVLVAETPPAPTGRRLNLIRVCGGDGGGSNSPSRRLSY